MKTSVSFIVVLILSVTHLPAADAPPEGDGATTLASAVTDVTVYADRARITRLATVPPTAGLQRYAFRKLPGWLDEGSVRVSIGPAGAGELIDVQVVKTYLARPDDDSIRKAEQAVQELSDQVNALEDEKAAIEAQGRQIEAIRAFSLDKLPKDTAAREVKVDEYDGVVQFIGKSMLATARAKRDVEKKQRELRPEFEARQKTLNELQQRSQLEQRTVIVSMQGSGKPVALTLAYLLPGATWEAAHEIRTGDDTGSVSVASFAVVTQTTGEDWDGVTIHLSTQRSEETIRLPELEALLLHGAPNMARLNGAGSVSSFKAAADNFDGQWVLWNNVANPKAVQEELGRNWFAQKARQTRQVEMFKNLQQQRGTTEHFLAAGKQTIRTDGRPIRLAIGTLDLAAKMRIIAAPEISLNAARTAELVNTGRLPLLPGKVQLFASGAFLGTTDVPFVAPGETFSVFLGVADQVKLGRSLDRKRSSLTWTGRRRRMQASFLVTAANLSDRPLTLELGDRVPVSETEDIRVQSVRITPPVKPDVKGLLKWEVSLEPGEAREFRIEYELEYPTGLQAMLRAQPAADDSQQSEPARGRLENQILDMEKLLH